MDALNTTLLCGTVPSWEVTLRIRAGLSAGVPRSLPSPLRSSCDENHALQLSASPLVWQSNSNNTQEVVTACCPPGPLSWLLWTQIHCPASSTPGSCQTQPVLSLVQLVIFEFQQNVTAQLNTHLPQQTMNSDQYHTCLPGIKAKLTSFPDEDTSLGEVRYDILKIHWKN